MSIPGVAESIRRSTVLTDLAQVSEFRAMVRRRWAHRPGAAVDDGDLNLVATELITNAFVHGGADQVIVTLTDDDDGSALEVTHDLDGTIELCLPDSMPDPAAPGGRGLAIVRALTDDVVVSHRDGRLRVIARWYPQG